MQQKSFLYELKDGKKYEFCERAKEDVDYSHIQALIRKQKISEAYELIPKDDQALRDALIMDQFNKVYSIVDVSVYISSHSEEIKKLVYNSFKISNNIAYDDFAKLVDESMAKQLLNMITELEKSDEGLTDEQVCSELKINKNKLIEIKKAQPQIYDYLKHNTVIKKKKEG